MIDLRKQLKNPINQQYLLELLFPILGYLFFDWSFLIIVLFYLVDQLGNQINFFARLHFVQKLHLPKVKWIFPISIFIFLVLFNTELLWLFNLFTTEVYDCTESFFWGEMNDFLRNEFWLFMPLLIVANYFKDKMTFYKTDAPYQETPLKMVVFNMLAIVFIFFQILLIYSIWLWFKPSFLWMIILIAISKLLFDVLIFPKFKETFFRKI